MGSPDVFHPDVLFQILSSWICCGEPQLTSSGTDTSLWLSASLEVIPRSSPLLDRKWCLSLCWCEARRTFLHWEDKCSQLPCCSITNIITPAGSAACSLWWTTSPDQARPLSYTFSTVVIALGSSASGLPPPASHRQHRPVCSAEEC